MDPDAMVGRLGRLRRLVNARQVFGRPVERDGVTMVPAAQVIGGGGAGQGGRPGVSEPEGAGGGFGLVARPAGAFEISERGVRWRPALDPVPITAMVLLAALLATRWLLSARR